MVSRSRRGFWWKDEMSPIGFKFSLLMFFLREPGRLILTCDILLLIGRCFFGQSNGLFFPRLRLPLKTRESGLSFLSDLLKDKDSCVWMLELLSLSSRSGLDPKPRHLSTAVLLSVNPFLFLPCLIDGCYLTTMTSSISPTSSSSFFSFFEGILVNLLRSTL